VLRTRAEQVSLWEAVLPAEVLRLPVELTPIRARQARAMYDARQHTVQEIADTFGVSRPPSTGIWATPPLPRHHAPCREQAPAIQ